VQRRGHEKRIPGRFKQKDTGPRLHYETDNKEARGRIAWTFATTMVAVLIRQTIELRVGDLPPILERVEAG
jgi:hypothetical protein